MAAQPKKKISKVRSKTRRAHQAKSLPNLMKLGGLAIPHHLVSYHKRYGTAATVAKPAKPAPTKTASKPKSKTSKVAKKKSADSKE